ncbi:hypothetical protein K1719_011423 [Acacia pycnantha]|nr:hypothetical protein K1719_011423 [Acacia pycnantha]
MPSNILMTAASFLKDPRRLSGSTSKGKLSQGRRSTTFRRIRFNLRNPRSAPRGTSSGSIVFCSRVLDLGFRVVCIFGH